MQYTAYYKGRILTSDQPYVYSHNYSYYEEIASAEANSQLAALAKDNYIGEWEFGEKEIVFTGTAAYGVGSSPPIVRQVWSGRFTYNDVGRLSGGSIDEYSYGTKDIIQRFKWQGDNYPGQGPIEIGTLAGLDLNNALKTLRYGVTGAEESFFPGGLDWVTSPFGQDIISTISTVENLGSTMTVRIGSVSDRKVNNNSRRIAIVHNERMVPILGWPDAYDSEGVYEIRGANQITTIDAEVKGSSVYLLGQSDLANVQSFYYLTRHDLATGVQTGLWDSRSFSFKTDPAQTAYITIFEDNWAPYEGTPYAYLKDDFLKFRQEFSFLSIPAHGTGEIIRDNGSNGLSGYTTAGEILKDLVGEESLLTSISLDPKEDTEKLFKTATWSNTVKINRMVQAAAGGATIEAKQTDEGGVGSVLRGSDNNDRLLGRAGWDIFDGRGGRDFIRGGNGRDVITGGLDADELWGDLGWNTYTSEKDGSADLIVIKSDQFLLNPLLGKAGNNTNGAKCDIIEGLDTTDRIRLLGVRSADISIQGNVNAKGVTGIGIYGAGYLEALYIGGDLTVDQITSMTSGDASPAAMANQISSYGWIDAPGTLIDEFVSRNPAEELISRLGLSKSPNSTVSITPADASQLVMASTWSGSVRINHVVQAAVSGGEINAVQTFEGSVGSVLRGSEEDDILKGRAGWDIFDGRGGNDFIRGGNGRDIISGGDGSDELWGDLGWNTFMDERDGSEDLLVIKSDQFLLNPILGKSGNNEDGSKCDIIEGLDSFDQIRILGVSTDEISFGENVNAKGVSGIGIYGAGSLEALYIGGDLTVGQISAMTSGDASIEAMNNQVSSYGWIQNPGIL